MKNKLQALAMSMAAMLTIASIAQATPAQKATKGVQKATITIDGGYSPSSIKVKKGMPVELTFIGGKNLGCGGTVVFKSLKISKEVAVGKSTVIKFTPKKAGDISFTCGMGMLQGKVVVI